MRIRVLGLTGIGLVLSLFISCHRPPAGARVQGTIGRQGMVVSTHPLASDVGLAILQQGGNAADAAVATFFALAVVFPEAGNLGGGGFAVYRWQNGQIGSLDFREKAPARASRDMYLDAKGEPIKNLSLRGHLAAGVPGAVDGMVELHQKLGRLPWQQVVQPAIDLARQGHVLTEIAANNFNRSRADFEAANLSPIYLVRADRAWQKGDTVRHLDLARTLERVRDQGRAGFYEGPTADLIEQEMQAGKGLITKADLAAYRSAWRAPLTGTYRKKYRVISMPPPSSGGVALLQLLQGAEAYPISKWGHNHSQTVHTMIELERRVYADRATHLGDPDFYKVPLAMLLDPAYNRGRNANISPVAKTPSQQIKEGRVDRIESTETTHFSVADREGNAISLTTTLNGYYGCKVMVRGGGFFLNNEMDDFSVKPGSPNQFGLVGGEANAIVSHKRMLSSMTPTIVEKNGKLHLVVGTPGGSTIITGVYQVVLNVLDHGMTLQEAVNARRFHHQWLPDNVLVERGALPDSVRQRLTALGHQLIEVGNLCKVDAILVRPDGSFEGAADHTRSDGKAAGW
ncbi:MAG: gamma-glutamyltransferase [Bernardetiaceae bacterium]|nr:gamma-glutamyltransferase [Bernardetiaceae bacterium]